MLQGQWLGSYSGQSQGTIILNIDEILNCFEILAYIDPRVPGWPTAYAYLQTDSKASNFQIRTMDLRALHPDTGLPTDWELIKHRFMFDAAMSKFADVRGQCANDVLSLAWKTDIGLEGTCALKRSQGGTPSALVPRQLDWSDFKRYLAEKQDRRPLFRGQSISLRLRTAFHRNGRANLLRFLNEDIPKLHKQLSARTRHVFDLDKPKENGAFVSLLQHHGYPTPLLDWTYSPYVAAFFAYRGIRKRDACAADEPKRVRVFLFDQLTWQARYRQIMAVVHPSLHVSLTDFLAIENERMIPQQAVSMLSNVDDIESYIKGMEREGETLLEAIDLPVRQRDEVMQDLRYMGITAGSMFPGLDGACEEMKELYF